MNAFAGSWKLLPTKLPTWETLPAWLRLVLSLGWWVGVAVVFGLAYTQTPLYEGNQNTKFLHGLAQAGFGYLHEDWLANTADPLPLFSLLVNLTARINPDLFYIYYFILFGVYCYSLWGIASQVFGVNRSLNRTLLFLAGILAVHARWLIMRLEVRQGLNIEFLQNGLAGQYLLGLEFQNSSFGVLLLLSIYAFLRRKYISAIASLVIACLFHSAYLFSAALITLAYLLVILFEELQSQLSVAPKATLAAARSAKKPLSFADLLQAARRPFWLGLTTLLLVAPLVWYNQAFLGASSAESQAQALSILVHERIPHHTQPAQFLNRTADLQMVLILVGVLLTLRSRLFAVMTCLACGGLIFSAVQIWTGSDSLALLGPWRVSVLLVPLSTSLILAAIIAGIARLLSIPRRASQNAPLALLDHPLLLLVIAPLVFNFSSRAVRRGMDIQSEYGASFRQNQLVEMMDFVRAHLASGQVYMVEPREAEFDDFRLYTGAPIMINWKSHPYKDSDVLEWYQRVQQADAFYNAPGEIEKCAILKEINARYGVTHVLVKKRDAGLNCGFNQAIFQSTRYTIFALSLP
jgi:hypothetical protein